MRISRLVRTRDQRHARLTRDLARFEFVPHHGDVFRAGTDKGNPILRARLREGGALGEKSISGVKRVTGGPVSRGDKILNFQVTIARACRADTNSAVGHLRRHAFAVGVGDGGDGLDAQALTRPYDSHGDLAAVGN